MNIEPSLRYCKFEQLSSGDLFVYMHDKGSCIALTVEDPTANGQRLIMPFGPRFPESINGPVLLSWQGMDVISFGKEFILRLPVHSEGWSLSEPSNNTLFLLVADNNFYVRANCSGTPDSFLSCYINISTGLIYAEKRGPFHSYMRPTGIRAIAIEWELLTTEFKPRVIFSQRTAT